MLKIFEMFSGYGGASFALKKAGIPFECVGYSEIDKFAVQCYNQNHFLSDNQARENFDKYGFMASTTIPNFGDATKINPKELPDFDLLTGGFPCQSFSVAGKGLGEQDTRGTLFHDIIRIAERKKPKFMLLENVKGLMSKKHEATFGRILSEIGRIGYHVNFKVLNSKDYGIPQNRERVFILCIRDDLVDSFVVDWPEPEELKLFLKDILEDEVDKKYYLSKEQTEKLLFPGKHNLSSFRTRNIITNNYSPTLLAGMSHGNTVPLIVQLNNPSHSNNRVYAVNGISPTINTMQGGNRQPFIFIRNATIKGYLKAVPGDGINLEQPNSKTRRGRVQKGLCSTLQTNDQRGVLLDDCSIRKLTPAECFRLMGFLNDEINLERLSNTQRYKLAGNGWDINLVSKIFKMMFT